MKHFFEKKFGSQIDLSHLNRLVDLATDYDCWIRRFPISTFVAELYKGIYEPYQFRKRFMGGDCRLTTKEIEFIRKRKLEFIKVYDNVVLNDIPELNGCLVMNDRFVNEISQKLADDGYMIVFTQILGKGRISVRQYDPTVDIGAIMERLEIGGGHEQAAGFFESDDEIMWIKIEAICAELVGLESFKKPE